MALFDFGAQRIELSDGWLFLDNHFLSKEEADFYFAHFKKNLPWQQGEIKLFGKTHPTPRLESYHAEKSKTYTYSGQTLPVQTLTAELKDLKTRIETQFDWSLNAVLANLYRDGRDSNGWHADNEPELGKNPQIASLSLGATRRFDLKHSDTGKKITLELNHGSLLLMGGALQHHWKHQIAKTTKVYSERINLTFRSIIS